MSEKRAKQPQIAAFFARHNRTGQEESSPAVTQSPEDPGREVTSTSAFPVDCTCSQPCCVGASAPNQPTDLQILRRTEKQYTVKGQVKGRCVQSQWFKDYPWLTLCETNQKLFCYPCKIVYENKELVFSKNAELVFLKDGFNNWKKALEKFKTHESSISHKELAMKLTARRKPPITALISNQTKQQQTGRRQLLLKQIECVSFLVRQGLAIRGHASSEGNLIELLKLRSKDVPSLNEWLKQGSYLSPHIVNEQIDILATTVTRNLLADIQKVGWYALIADEACDITNHEQLNITIRWVDDGFLVHEDPLGLIWVPNTSGETLYKAVLDALIRANLPLKHCRGQAYDGAANMQGKAKGVATRITKEEPAAIHVHCLAHCLNLCLQEVTRQSKPVRDALDLINEIIRLIKWSPTRAVLFENIKMETSPENPNLRKLCPTRWTMRTASIDSVIRSYTVLMETLEEVNRTGTDEYARQAGGQVLLMEKFSTFFGMKLSHLLFSASEQLSRTLQSKQTTAGDGCKAATMAKAFYRRQRSTEHFESFYNQVVEEAKKVDQIEEPMLPRRRKVPRRIDNGSAGHQFESPQEYYRRQYFEVIDAIVVEIEQRFEQPSFQFVGTIERLLLDAANGVSFEIPLKVRDLYAEDIDMDRLETQLKMLLDFIRGQCPGVISVTTIATITSAFASSSKPVQCMLNEVFILLKLYLTIPVTSSTSERSFSCLRRIKTYLRNTMTQERLNHVMTCNIFKERVQELDLVDIAKEFVDRNDRRVGFFGRFE